MELIQQVQQLERERLSLINILEAEVDELTEVIQVNEDFVIQFKPEQTQLVEQRGFLGRIKSAMGSDRPPMRDAEEGPTPESIRKKIEQNRAGQKEQTYQDEFKVPTVHPDKGPQIGDAVSDYYKGNKALFIIASINNGIAYLQDPKHPGAKAKVEVAKLANGKPSRETTRERTYKMLGLHGTPPNADSPAVIYTVDKLARN